MTTGTLISPDSNFAVWAALLGLTALAFWSEKTRIGKKFSGAVVAIMIGMLISNLGIIPRSAPAYDIVWAYFVPLAIPFLLFKADIRRIIKEAKGVLIAFLFGAAGTVIGAFLGALILPDGQASDMIKGIISAGHIGGSMNIAAVGTAVGVGSDLMSFIVTSVGVTLVLYLILLGMLPSLAIVRRWVPSAIIDESEQRTGPSQADLEAATPAAAPLDLLHLSFGLFLSFAICALGKWMASALGVPAYAILFITALVLVVANLFPKRLATLSGDIEVGMLLLYVFFVTVGAGADIAAMLSGQMIIWMFNIIVVLTHLVIILSAARLLKLDLAEVLIASNACVVGAATAAGMAACKGWRDLVTPGVMVGVLGYAIANFIGVALVKL
tara:strand:- start:5380 stop:6531 length:1152 start_codon:yes stop_codon:yes gene_type:complete